ncbi:MAG: RNA-directed DNA polymerase [Parabacteroides sp.]|nr:RNA-directed DNA polymerase [Parabacteroides sp.]
MNSILDLNHIDAQIFFLKGESYCNIDFPFYFDFDTLINNISKNIKYRNLNECCNQIDKGSGKLKLDSPSNYEKVCYQLLTNKDGKYDWRPLQLIHPVLYCLLVKEITTQNNWIEIKNRFKQYSADKNIECLSLPIKSTTSLKDKAESVLNWWTGIEQHSIKLSMKYSYVFVTDITNCYGSIYTHSISWALHTIDVSKQKNNNLLGDKIDYLIRNMNYGQTNGIPQGSVMMDFIAEIILGYLDEELSKKLISDNITEYKILRYRDDYRIFSNSIQELETITKLLTETLISVGLKLNSNKTLLSSDIIKSSLKADKLYYITNTPIYNRNRHSLFSTIQHELLYIHDIATKYPNSGVLSKLLSRTYKKRILKIKHFKEDASVLISIIVDIIFKNPRTYPIGFAIISKLLDLDKKLNNKDILITDILNKFKKIPNTGHMQIWLQRISYPLNKNIEFTENICKLLNNDSLNIWESNWLNPKLKSLIESSRFIDREKLQEISPILEMSEISFFEY